MYVYFKTDKDQFIIPVWDYVLARSGGDSIPEIIRQQPLGKMWTGAQGHRVLGLTTASSALEPSDLRLTEHDLRKTLNNTELLAGLKMLASKYQNHTPYKRMMRVKKGLEDGSLTLCTFDPLLDFSKNECIALFCTMKNGQEGYISRNGGLGTLARALTFESEKDALSDINRRGMYLPYKTMQAVRVDMTVSGLGGKLENSKSWDDKVDFSKTSIYSVDALAQKNKINDALQQASLDQLREAYEKLSGVAWGDGEAQSKPKKKM